MNIIEPHEKDFDNCITFFEKNISKIRTNRITTELISDVLINVYGTKTPLEQVASLSLIGPRTIMIESWDKSIIKEIANSLTNMELGAIPNIEGQIIHLNLPPLNEDTRKKMVKLLHSKAEESRISLRSIRDKVKTVIIMAEKSKEITEDDKYILLEKLDKIISAKNEKIKLIGDKKEKEIMSNT
ncbi:ribosome recycling factor [Patescibacteria group bacterium]|nr:ribosome recycling factor [Patescibacteria group bacterium]